MKTTKTFLLGVLILLFTQILYAQDSFSLELRTGADFATQELGDADLNTGFGFDGILAYHFSLTLPYLAAGDGITSLRMIRLPV